MSSVRYIIKDRLERTDRNLDKCLAYLQEVDSIFSTYGDRYAPYLEMERSIAAMIDELKDFTEKLNDSV